MDSHAESAKYLQSLIGRTLRIHISDTRIFVGEFKCTDNDRNIILALTYEYRPPATVAAPTAKKNSTTEALASMTISGTESSQATAQKGTNAATSASAAMQEQKPSTTATTNLSNMPRRFVGLVVIPGQHITKIELEEVIIPPRPLPPSAASKQPSLDAII